MSANNADVTRTMTHGIVDMARPLSTLRSPLSTTVDLFIVPLVVVLIVSFSDPSVVPIIDSSVVPLFDSLVVPMVVSMAIPATAETRQVVQSQNSTITEQAI